MCWHKWGKWEPYTLHYKTPPPERRTAHVENRQKRHCEKCGKVQDKMISFS